MIKLTPKNNINKPSEDTSSKLEESSSITEIYTELAGKNSLGIEEYKRLVSILSSIEFREVTDFITVKNFALLLLKDMKELSNKTSKIDLVSSSTGDVEIEFELPSSFIGLESLVKELIEDNASHAKKVIPILENYLWSLEGILTDDNIMKVYGISADFMKTMCVFEFPQRKYLYKNIAEVLTNYMGNYSFISPEDVNHIDPSFHRVIEGSGIRIKCGLSFVLIQKNSNSVLEFGNVKTY